MSRKWKSTSKTTAVWIAMLAAAVGGTLSASAQTPGAGSRAGGYGYGPGMMGGGDGPGMMGGGYGPGMMGGGWGMMGFGGGWEDALGLSDDQKTKINRIQDESRHERWALMGNMMDQQAKLRDLYEAPKRDSAAIDETYKSIGDLRQKMYDSSVSARKRMEAVLTSKQLEKLRTYREQDGSDW
jgi:Spy/CpxP family protein refolding chaperone